MDRTHGNRVDPSRSYQAEMTLVRYSIPNNCQVLRSGAEQVGHQWTTPASRSRPHPPNPIRVLCCSLTRRGVLANHCTVIVPLVVQLMEHMQLMELENLQMCVN
jgi:hypothetical protein